MGEGLLSRLYLHISKLGTSDGPSVLTSKDLARVRAKTEKMFPDLPPDYTKVSNSFYYRLISTFNSLLADRFKEGIYF